MTATIGIRRVFATAALATFFAAASSIPAGAATDAERAEALIREGVQLRANDAAARALPLFEQAYQLSRTPRTAAQLGLCELDLGYFVAAERYLSEALAAPDHPWVAKNKATLKKPLETARANIGELSLIVAPASAEVSLNHKLVDRTSLAAPLRLNKGPVDLEVRAPGYQPALETITIVGGKREDRTFSLVPEPAHGNSTITVAGAPADGAQAAPGPADANPLAIGASASQPPADATATKRRAAWITGGAAAAAMVFGTVEAFNAASKRDAFNDHTGTVGGVVVHDCGTASVSGACKPLKDDYDRALTLTVVGFVAAGALAAASSVLFVLSSPGQGGAERDGARAFACVPDPVSRGLGCSVRF